MENLLKEMPVRDFVIPTKGMLLEGIITKLDPDKTLVDFRGKTEGVLETKELMRGDNQYLYKEGDAISVYAIGIDPEDSEIKVSLQKNKNDSSWTKVLNAFRTEEPVTVKVLTPEKNGFLVKIFNLTGFLPKSQILEPDLFSPEEQTEKMTVQIIDCNKEKRRIIVSEKVLKNRELADVRRDELKNIKVGDVVQGKIVGFKPYGAFVRVGNLDGLLHVSEITWDHVEKINDILHAGQTINLKVEKIDTVAMKLSLSLKALLDSPWEKIKSKIHVGDVVEGKITRIVDYGMFVETSFKIEGLVHISEVSWDFTGNLNKNFKVGEKINVKVIDFNPEKYRLSLSIKQLKDLK